MVNESGDAADDDDRRGSVGEVNLGKLEDTPRGTAPIGTEREERGSLLLRLVEGEVRGLVGQPERLEDVGHLGVRRQCWRRRPSARVECLLTFQPLGPNKYNDQDISKEARTSGGGAHPGRVSRG